MPRIHCPLPLSTGQVVSLPAGPARHVQVLRLQPGDDVTLFDGAGGEWQATIARMGRSDVDVTVGAHDPVERETKRAVHLAVGLPANERMDWLVEKATELGVASIQPLAAARSVLKLAGERAEKKRAHWQGIAIAACEQCGRNRVPVVHPVQPLGTWMESLQWSGARMVLSLATGATPPVTGEDALVLSGPEGGLTREEEALALDRGFVPVSLGARVLRAETAPLALLAALTITL